MPGGPRTEAGVGRACIRLIEQHGGWTFRVVQTGRQKRGAPDQLAVAYGRMLGIEWKAPESTSTGYGLTEHQARNLRQINAAGGLGIMVRDADRLARVLDALRRGATVTADAMTFHPLINGDPA